MILIERMKQLGQYSAIAACALVLTACGGMMEEQDVTTGSRLAQPAAGTPPQKPIDAGDIAIVGQEVAHAIVQLPSVASAPVPPLVQFAGVTSIVLPPIDTTPYTELLRDRLLLLTREKLRFVERTLPAFVPKKKHKSDGPPSNTGGNADYEVLAELRGHADSDFYRIQVEFVDLRSNQVLFNEVYRISREAASAPAPEAVSNPAPEPTREVTGESAPPPKPSRPAPPVQPHDMTTPTTSAPVTGNETL